MEGGVEVLVSEITGSDFVYPVGQKLFYVNFFEYDFFNVVFLHNGLTAYNNYVVLLMVDP